LVPLLALKRVQGAKIKLKMRYKGVNLKSLSFPVKGKRKAFKIACKRR